MNLAEVIQLNAKKELYKLKIEINELATLERFLRGIVVKY